MERAAGTQPAAAYASRSIKAAAHENRERKTRPLFLPSAGLSCGRVCNYTAQQRKTRREPKNGHYAPACYVPAFNTRAPFDPRLRVRPIACARLSTAFWRQKPQQKKKQFCGLVPGLQPVKTAGALHPSAAEKNGRKNSPPCDIGSTAQKQPARVMVHSCGRGHHLRPASLAALASACARVGLWPFLPLI